MPKTVLHKAHSRGVSSSGWIYAKHTFCFADYFNSERIHFGALRVINNMTIAPGKGLTNHPHADIEIILLTMKGDLLHADSLGNEVELNEGSVQVISAGSGYSHEEINRNSDQSVNFLQIWIFPYRKNLVPNYSYKQFEIEKGKNKFQLLVSPYREDRVAWIQQNTWLYITNLYKGNSLEYSLNNKENGVYILVTKGRILVAEQELDAEDGMGMWELEDKNIVLTSLKDAQIILIEVPMVNY